MGGDKKHQLDDKVVLDFFPLIVYSMGFIFTSFFLVVFLEFLLTKDRFGLRCVRTILSAS